MNPCLLLLAHDDDNDVISIRFFFFFLDPTLCIFCVRRFYDEIACTCWTEVHECQLFAYERNRIDVLSSPGVWWLLPGRAEVAEFLSSCRPDNLLGCCC